MQVLFIRHAEAVDADRFKGEDLLRPLTSQGRRNARKAYGYLAKVMDPPDVLITSEAVRAQETADIFAACFGVRKIKISPLINPGSEPRHYRKLIREIGFKLKRIAIVGHEPDLASIVADIVAPDRLNIRIKKGACVEVEVNDHFRGDLLTLVPLRILLGRRKD